MGVIFCLATIVTPAQDSQPPAQVTQPPAKVIQRQTQSVQQGVQQTTQGVQQGVQQPAQGVQQGAQQPVQVIQQPVQVIQQPVQVIQQPVQVIQQPATTGGDEVQDAQKGSEHAAEVFRDFTEVSDKIPPDILCKAAAIGVFKGVVNAAFITRTRWPAP